jgi:flavin reductase (DIM6/NTAB) family NADH-FMN oxidoreductase RutF
MKNNLPLGSVYRLLEPGPVVLLTTVRNGRPNVMPMSWHMMMEFEPPLIGCIVSDRNHSFRALKATKECVINIPTVGLIKETVACGNCSGRSTDKFAVFGLTPLPALRVQAPLIAECPANLECRVVDTRLVSRYSLFVLEVVKAWRDPRPKRLQTVHHLGMGRFMIAGRTQVLASRAK